MIKLLFPSFPNASIQNGQTYWIGENHNGSTNSFFFHNTGETGFYQSATFGTMPTTTSGLSSKTYAMNYTVTVSSDLPSKQWCMSIDYFGTVTTIAGNC